MGQKTHPLGFRLGITQEHRSTWYADFKQAQYSNLLIEDHTIRNNINKLATLAGISNIQINRDTKGTIEINVDAARPGILVGNSDGNGLKSQVSVLKKMIPNKQIVMNVNEVENVNASAALIADLVVLNLESRVAFRRAIREGLQCAQDDQVNGIKIQVSGRLNGAEMARSEWISEGRVPLQTLRADIDYATREAKTIYGILCVKVWLFKNEILKK